MKKNDFKSFWKTLNKRSLIVGISILLIIVFLILIIMNFMGTNSKNLTCTRTISHIDGFRVGETLIVKVKKNKIINIEMDKKVEIGEQYQKFPTYFEIVKKSLSSAYTYVPNDKLKLVQEDNYIKASFKINEGGIILDNLKIEQNNPSDIYDISFNTQSNFDAASTTYKINDEYKPSKLMNKFEELGYSCK